jgi:hypothetical protein
MDVNEDVTELDEDTTELDTGAVEVEDDSDAAILLAVSVNESSGL